MFGKLFSSSKKIKIISEKDVLKEQALENVANVIWKPSHESNYSLRNRAGKILDESSAHNYVDTFIIHDPGFYDLNDLEKNEKLRKISPERKFQITIDELTLPDKKKSAHFTMDYDGKIYMHVLLHQKAWHAGKSELYGRENLNNTSIGIEVMEPYTEIQYMTLALLINDIRKTYTKIDPTRIVGHKQVSPGRKHDPINFDWDKLFKYLYK